MEGENKPEAKIPIEEYVIDMETYLTKEKKNEILGLFSNSNNLLSEEEFKEIKYKLHNACQDGDLELIKILLSETIQDDSKDLTFKIDKTNQTASLFKVKANVKHVIIPRSIKHDSVDYLVTSITGTDFYIKSIKFLDDSAVKTIYRSALSGMYIEELCFPASLKELKEGWCDFTNSLTKITVSPLNGQFLFNENKCLFGKSDPNKDEFDVLLFASRDIEEVVIPSNIKIISSFAFEHCRILKKVEIPKNSNLETIGSNAFLNSDIEEIFIPPKITKICESTFEDCRKLTKVEIPPNSNLQSICYKAFSNSSVKELYFPASLKELKDEWCIFMNNLTKITVSPLNGQFLFNENKCLFGKSDPNKDEFDVLLFASRDIEEVIIPSNIKIISSFAFEHCENLRKVEIPKNSNLETIGSNAFSNSNIEEIFIPPKVTSISEFAFYCCENLRKVEIPKNSNLEEIGFNAFSVSLIQEFVIPSNVAKINECAFFSCNKLLIIEIPEESRLEKLPKSLRKKKDLTIMIPHSLKGLIIH